MMALPAMLNQHIILTAQKTNFLHRLAEFIASTRLEDASAVVWGPHGSVADVVRIRSVVGGGGPMLALVECVFGRDSGRARTC